MSHKGIQSHFNTGSECGRFAAFFRVFLSVCCAALKVEALKKSEISLGYSEGKIRSINLLICPLPYIAGLYV